MINQRTIKRFLTEFTSYRLVQIGQRIAHVIGDTAKALNLKVPPSLIALADEVVE
jgi:hypothetical protein